METEEPTKITDTAVPTASADNVGIDQIKSCPSLLGCCNGLRFKSDDATGFAMNACGSGPVIMSNAFLATSLIVLAKMEIGCGVDSIDPNEECEGKVYGFKPTSLITITATLAGFLACLFLPFLGAIVDYTRFRHKLGVISSSMLVLIQAIQIGTVQATWFPMAILQSINAFMYLVVMLCQYSYLPEIKKQVDTKTMIWYNSLFYVLQFGNQTIFLFVVVGASLAFKLDDVVTAQFSQAVNVLMTGYYFYLSWYFFTEKEAKNQLGNGENLITAGFQQVFRTAKGIFKFYPRTVGLYFVGIIFIEATMISFTPASITYIVEVLKLNATQVGVVYIITLFSTMPGSLFANWLSNKTNPIMALKLNIIVFSAVNVGGYLLMQDPSDANFMYGVAFLWGVSAGWYYPLEKLIFSIIIPSGQESELAGFFLYCTRFLSWLPPLIFTIMNESGIHLSWAGMHLNIYLWIGLVFFMFMPHWQECIQSAKEDNKMKENNEL